MGRAKAFGVREGDEFRREQGRLSVLEERVG
jgi:hypothetical protein